MQKILFGLLLLPLTGFSQLSLGVKGGLNFVNVTHPAGINANSRSGYMIGAFLTPKSKKLIGFRTEVLLSRQGYDYKTGSNSGSVNLDYLLLPQLMVLRFTKKFELHAGGQLAFLLNANVDSTGSGSGSLFDYFNRFDYGAVAGIQVSPVSGLFIGTRINLSFKNMNQEEGPGGPDFIPKEFIKNNVLQLYAGWRF